MKHYIQIETPKPPEGATHYNPRLSLCFEKHEGGNIFVWSDNKWYPLSRPELGRRGSCPIIYK